jgi:Trypsin-like peptidase domain
MSKAQAVLRVGDGRGFVVSRGGAQGIVKRLVITAAHCLPVDDDGRLKLPPPHPASHLHERTYPELLGAEPAVWAECLFVDPIADIAVLGTPDNQALHDEAEAYQKLVTSARCWPIADAPQMGRRQVQLGGGISCEVDEAGQGSAYVLSLDGAWLKCAVTRFGTWLPIEQDGKLIASGMSGSPIVSTDDKAIGLVSTGRFNPVLKDSLPAWFFRRRRALHTSILKSSAAA